MSSPPGHSAGGTLVEPDERRWPTWAVVAVVVALYAIGALLVFIAFGVTAIVLLFLPAGVTVSALILTDRQQWPWILGAIAVTEVVIDLSQGQTPYIVSGFALANATEPFVGAYLFRRYVAGRVDLLRRRDLVAFVVCCCVVGPLVGALIGGTTISVGFGRDWFDAFVSFWAGDATGVLTVGGLILTWRFRRGTGRAPVTSLATALVATVVVTAAGFWRTHLPLFYLPIPLLFALAFAQPLHVMVASGLAMTVTANWMTSAGLGPWFDLTTAGPMKTATLQLFLAVAILGAWILAIGIAERDSARNATSAERAARHRLNAIQTLTAQLARASTSQSMAEAVVRDGILLVADRGVVGLVSPNGAEVDTWTTDQRPPRLDGHQLRVPLDSAWPLTAAVRTNTPVLHQSQAEALASFPHLADLLRSANIHSGLSVPVRGEGGPAMGALGFGFADEDAIDPDTVAFAEALASLTGQALRRAQTYERERDAAHQLQRALLPVLTREFSGVRVDAEYRSADSGQDVGGDWYDAFDLPGGRIGFAVGDVAGHHLTAAAAMARCQSALRIVAHAADGPAEVLDELDRVSGLVSDSVMTTVGYADYDPATRVLRYACAGHLPPLLITDTGSTYLEDARNLPIGVNRSGRVQGECAVPAGATLLWYTDGLVERRNGSTTEALDHVAVVAASMACQDPDDLCRSLIAHMTAGRMAEDDTVVLSVRFPHPA